MSQANANLINSIAASVAHHGPTAMYIALPLESWYDIIDSLEFCIENENLEREDLGVLMALHSSLGSKARKHAARLKKLG